MVEKVVESLTEEAKITVETEEGDEHQDLLVREINTIDGKPLVRCTGQYKEYVIEYDKTDESYLFWNRMSERRDKKLVCSVDLQGFQDD